jgi:hypothetical protein
MLGAKVATLVDELKVPGRYNVDIDAEKMQLSPGIYFAKINSGLNSQTIEMVLTE